METSKRSFFFVLGSHPEISVAEIEAVTLKRADHRGAEALILESAAIAPETQQKRLAGTIKIGEVRYLFPDWCQEKVIEAIAELIIGKKTFGISVYDAGGLLWVKKIRQEARALGLAIKRQVKLHNQRLRFVTSREPTLSSAAVLKNGLLRDGVEIVILVLKNGKIALGTTRTVQDFEAWSRRDFGRPRRNARSGLLPPKLARMMINLAGGDPKQSVLLDPFCGSGTILMEAVLIGFSRVIGSDVSKSAVHDSKVNLAWALPGRPLLTLIVAEAAQLRLLGEQRPNIIVTEPYLGPPLRGREKPADLEKIRNNLLALYQKSFSHLSTLLRPGGILVTAFPVIGGRAVVPNVPLMRPYDQPLRYRRSDQLVGREIVRWKKQSAE